MVAKFVGVVNEILNLATRTVVLNFLYDGVEGEGRDNGC
jgi:hypothetical protein